jgi:hypothetical protein
MKRMASRRRAPGGAFTLANLQKIKAVEHLILLVEQLAPLQVIQTSAF